MANRLLSQQDKIFYRTSVQSLSDWQTMVETTLRRNLSLSKQNTYLLSTLTGQTALPNQLEVVEALLTSLQDDYSSRLQTSAKDDFASFVEYMTPDEPPAPHHEYLCDKLMAWERREIMRMTVSMPPGHAKTKFCSRYFPAWYLGRNPNHKWLHAGHSQDFAENEFGKHVRDIIQEEKYQALFPNIRLNPSTRGAGNWRLAQFRGGYVCKGVGQKIAGFRGNAGGGDDLLGSRADAASPTIRDGVNNWMFTDFRTRFLPNSPIFLVATRWHPDDVIGFVEKMTKENRGIPWEIINLNALIETEEESARDPLHRSVGDALWPDFYDINSLLELKATLLSSDWWALYKGSPTDQESGVVKGVWFQRYDGLPTPAETRRVTISVDCAEKDTARAKYTAIGAWVEDVHRRHYLANVVRKKLEFVEMVKAINDMAIQYNAKAILIEDAGAGTQYIQQQGKNAPAPVISIPKPGTSKSFRFDGVAPMFQAGEIYLPKVAPWLADYEQELLVFPSTYTDQADMTSQYLEWSRARRKFGTKRMRGTAG